MPHTPKNSKLFSLARKKSKISREAATNSKVFKLVYELLSSNRSTMKKPILSKNVVERITWVHENNTRDWKNIMFFWWILFFGHKILSVRLDLPPWINFSRRPWNTWSRCMSRAAFQTNWNFISIYREFGCQKMVKIYQRALILSAEKRLRNKSQDWIFQENNNPKHRNRFCCQWKGENNIVTLDRLSPSPDTNPIENVWGSMKLWWYMEKSIYDETTISTVSFDIAIFTLRP